jgi:hypothetical protein
VFVYRLVFSQSVYFVNISEQTPLEQEILRVYATDNDVNPVNKDFVYRIPPDRSQYENRQHLRLDTVNGRIRLKKNFDREKSSTISVPIEAMNNRSSNMLIGRAVLVINVLDVNDNYPRFAENYSPRIREHSASKKILEFKVNDPDEPKIGKNKFQIKLGKSCVLFDSDLIIQVSKNRRRQTARVNDILLCRLDDIDISILIHQSIVNRFIQFD